MNPSNAVGISGQILDVKIVYSLAKNLCFMIVFNSLT